MGQALLTLSPSQERVVVRRAKALESNPPTPVEGQDPNRSQRNSPKSAGSAENSAEDIDPDVLMQHEVGSATVEQPSHDMTSAGHYGLILLFYGVLILYCVALVLGYLSQPPLELNSIALASELDPVPLSLTLTCLGGNACGNMTIATNYSYLADDAVRQAACAGGATAPVELTRNVSHGETVDLFLCYFPDPVYSSTTIGPLQISGLVVSVDGLHSGGWAGLDIRHQAANGETYHKFLTVAPGMVKSFNMGLSQLIEDDILIKLVPYSKNYQMEGLRLDTISDVVLQFSPYANLQEISTERSILVLLADMGSMFELIKLLFIVLVPLWALLFAKKSMLAGGVASVDEEEEKQHPAAPTPDPQAVEGEPAVQAEQDHTTGSVEETA